MTRIDVITLEGYFQVFIIYYFQIYKDITEKNRHQHKYFPIINMCLFMFTGDNSSGIT